MDGSSYTKKLYYDQVFKLEGSTGSKFHDIWASALFIGTVLACIAVTAYAMIMVEVNVYYIQQFLCRLMLGTLGLAFLLSQLYLLVVQFLPDFSIWATGILQILFCLLAGIVLLFMAGRKDASFGQMLVGFGTLFIILAVVFVFVLFGWVSRIPFSVLMVHTGGNVAKHYGHVFLTAFLGGTATFIVSIWYSVTVFALLEMRGPRPEWESGNIYMFEARISETDWDRPTSTGIGLTVFVTFAFYWITEVLKNIIHVTLSGVYGSWYFCARKPYGFPLRATRSAFGRAITYSFGSISFGSLLVATVRFLHQVARFGQSGYVGRILLACLERITEFINEYAFSYIALFGASYFSAAKATWRMMKDRGIILLANECIIDPVLTMGSILIGLTCVTAVYIWLSYFTTSDDLDDFRNSISGGYITYACAFFLSAQLCNVFLMPIKSGVTTILVAMAVEPEVLVKDHPDLYNGVVKFYPDLAKAVRA